MTESEEQTEAVPVLAEVPPTLPTPVELARNAIARASARATATHLALAAAFNRDVAARFPSNGESNPPEIRSLNGAIADDFTARMEARNLMLAEALQQVAFSHIEEAHGIVDSLLYPRRQDTRD
ncbi:hypothetical protein A6A40_24480 (plasmid) [Azospirillum humicireducens]|uniref:Uncharacterized protein n=1 Tax=Azospirillum humicireducens TaxID=1226968 RepID=A0A2R4VUS8_9PROT|nr:hypothetical protein [Azospirillum humicireducens]AWB08185.1 hypothetical protein A6A40_24480 [Azospirillum humicireducens]